MFYGSVSLWVDTPRLIEVLFGRILLLSNHIIWLLKLIEISVADVYALAF